jgi:hypothetical protein
VYGENIVSEEQVTRIVTEQDGGRGSLYSTATIQPVQSRLVIECRLG